MKHRTPLAVVTGASAGLGEAIARKLADKGYRVIAVARRQDALERLANASDRSLIVPCVADLETDSGLSSIVAAVDKEGGALDLLVNNAGRGHVGALAKMPLKEGRSMIRLNVEAPLLLTRQLLPGLALASLDSPPTLGARQRVPTVLMIASVAGVLPGPLMATYYATKAFLLSLGWSLSAELAPEGVRVITACPGPIATEFHRVAGFDEDRYDYSKGMAGPDAVADWAIAALKKKRSVIFYRWFILSDIAARLLPRTITGRLMAIFQRRRTPKAMKEQENE